MTTSSTAAVCVVAASTGLLASANPGAPATGDRAGLVDQLALLKECGYDAVDLSDLWTPLADLDDREVHTLSRAIGEVGLSVAGASIIDLPVDDAETAKISYQRGSRAMEVALALGAPVISVGLHRGPGAGVAPGDAVPPWLTASRPPGHDDQEFAAAAGLLDQLCAIASEAGAEVSVEMNEMSLLNTGAGCLRLLDLVARDNLGINPDLGSLVRVPWPLSESWAQTLSAVAPRMNYWHVKNCHRIGLEGGRFASTPSTMPEGAIDYRRALAMARLAGFDGPIVVEHYGGDVLWYAEAAHRYLTGLLT